MKKETVISGLQYGLHNHTPETFPDVVKKYGKNCELVMVRPRSLDQMTAEQYRKWAAFFRENEIYFCFHSNVRIIDGKTCSTLPKELVDQLYEIAGEYFIGTSLGEMGNSYSNHVYEKHGEENVQFKNMQEAKDTYIRDLQKLIAENRRVGIPHIGVVESNTMQKYDLEAGVDECYTELFLGNPEHHLAFTRGATRGYEREGFSGYIAHEWYAGVRHEDPLKDKRLGLMYKAAYMAGARKIFLENGYDRTKAYGSNGDENHPYCQMVRKEVEVFNAFIKQDERPAGGPKVKVAFVSGNLDGYTGNSTSYGGVISVVWGQRSRREWDRSAPEHSWRILDEVYRSCDWHYPINYGDCDYSTSPAYGQYDVLPAESTLAAMQRYDWLIFTGWNTMTEEIYEKLKAYVENGGNLLISAAHMKVGNVRGEDSAYIHEGKLEEFLGCNLTDRKFQSNKSFKFARESIVDGVWYPGPIDHTQDFIDPVGGDGYTTYVEIEEKDCRKAVFLGKSFISTPEDYRTQAPAMVEHTYGKGNVLFLCTDEYPGASGVYTLYKILVKSILAATHRNCEIKVISSDKVRFAVYEDGANYKLYLLNTDLNIPQAVEVLYKDNRAEKIIPSCNLETLTFPKEIK